MIATISKQGGRRYPQMGSTGTPWAAWVPSFGVTVADITTRDTHDGAWRKEPKRDRKQREENYRQKIAEREALRREIVEAIDGPAPVAAAAAAVLEELAEPQKTDALYRPLYTRLDWDKVWARQQAIETAILIAKAREAQAEEEDEIILMNLL